MATYVSHAMLSPPSSAYTLYTSLSYTCVGYMETAEHWPALQCDALEEKQANQPNRNQQKQHLLGAGRQVHRHHHHHRLTDCMSACDPFIVWF